MHPPTPTPQKTMCSSIPLQNFRSIIQSTEKKRQIDKSILQNNPVLELERDLFHLFELPLVGCGSPSSLVQFCFRVRVFHLHKAIAPVDMGFGKKRDFVNQDKSAPAKTICQIFNMFLLPRIPHLFCSCFFSDIPRDLWRRSMAKVSPSAYYEWQ